MIDFLSISIIAGWSITTLAGSVSFCVLLRKIPTKQSSHFAFNTITTKSPINKESDIVAFKLIPDDTYPNKIINVYNLNSKTMQYRFIKPINHINNEINLYWHQEFVLQDANKINIASIYRASIGKGSYIKFFDQENLNISKDNIPTFQFVLNKIKLKHIFNQQPINKYTRNLKLNDNIYISSKLRSDLYEFKLINLNEKSEQVKMTYRWLSQNGLLKRFSKCDKQDGLPIASIKDSTGYGYYLIEIDQSFINVDIVLCTSLICTLNK